MTADQIFARLKKIAPNVGFKVTLTPDNYHSWDGDGPDPRDSGYWPKNVDVTATLIYRGEILEETASMGGHYINDDKPDPDLGGYLPQMLEEVADGLCKQINPLDVKRVELCEVCVFLNKEMQERYDEQRQITAQGEQ